jgi:RES domain-containing protein
MRLWRISAWPDLLGTGGLRASARWHTRGRRVVYLADHPAAALLEILVHLEIDTEDLPTTYRIMTVEVPDDMAIADMSEADLPTSWRRRLSVSRRAGDAWIAGGSTALLRVPSAIVPDASNVLLNPVHPDAGHVRITVTTRLRLDRRLLRRGRQAG